MPHLPRGGVGRRQCTACSVWQGPFPGPSDSGLRDTVAKCAQNFAKFRELPRLRDTAAASSPLSGCVRFRSPSRRAAGKAAWAGPEKQLPRSRSAHAGGERRPQACCAPPPQPPQRSGLCRCRQDETQRVSPPETQCHRIAVFTCSRQFPLLRHLHTGFVLYTVHLAKGREKSTSSTVGP